MPFIRATHINCKFCGDTDCLFLQIRQKGKLYITKRCKPCTSDYNKDYYYAHKDKMLNNAKKWAKNNRERLREYGREYYKRNKNK